MPMERGEAMGKPGRATAKRPRGAYTSQPDPVPWNPLAMAAPRQSRANLHGGHKCRRQGPRRAPPQGGLWPPHSTDTVPTPPPAACRPQRKR
jgi:hypothetical protein